MRNRIRGLEQCSRNVQTGHSMLNVAAQAVERQVDIMGKMREIALKASDDTYTQKDRDILAVEANQLFDQLEMIARETTYNGIHLLDRVTSVARQETRTFTDFADFNPAIAGVKNTTAAGMFSETKKSQGWDEKGEPNNNMDINAALARAVNSETGNPAKIPEDFHLQGFSCMCDGCKQFDSIVFTADEPIGYGRYMASVNTNSPVESECTQYIIGIGGAQTVEDLAEAIYKGIKAANNTPEAAAHIKKGSGPARNNLPDTTLTGHHDLTMRYDEATRQLHMGQIKSNKTIFYDGTKGLSVEQHIQVSVISGFEPWEDKYIQSDTRGSQNTKIRLWNTTLDALFPPKDSQFFLEPSADEYPTSFDAADYPDPNEYPDRYEGYLGTDLEKKQQLWRDTVWGMAKAGAHQDGQCLRTRQGAQDFLGDLDQALKYALHAATSLGSQMMRMDISDANITTNHENTVASESTIRDADMAKEMTEYTKANVLSQAAQSMLAQANQNSSSVLGLLQ